MFDVSGYIDGEAYRLRHDPDDRNGETNQGSATVLARLATYEGERFSATPTGPFMVLDLTDGPTVLCALYALTDVRGVSGDAPDILTVPDAPIDAVF